MVVPMIHGW